MNERDLGDSTGGTFLAGGVGALLACCAVHFLVIAGVIAGMSGLALAIGTAIAALADRSGDERVAVMYAGDEPDAKQTVATLIDDLNFVPVDIRALADAAIMELGPGTTWVPVTVDETCRYLDQHGSSTNQRT